jgi:hypothetical protein
MSTNALFLTSTLGWVGAVSTVTAYALVSNKRLDANSMRFQAINLVGGGMLALSALSHGNWSSAASNMIWMFFGAQALVSARHLWRAGATRHWRNAKAHVVQLRRFGHGESSAAADWTTAA